MTRERHNGIPDTVQKPTKETMPIEGCTARFDPDTKNLSVSIYGEEYERVAALMRFDIGEDDGIRKEGNADDTIASLVSRANAWQKEARERIVETLRRHGGRVTYTPEDEGGEVAVGACVRCTMRRAREGTRITVRSLRVQSAYTEGETLPCTEAYANDVRVDAERGGYCFSDNMMPYDAFYYGGE